MCVGKFKSRTSQRSSSSNISGSIILKSWFMVEKWRTWRETLGERTRSNNKLNPHVTTSFEMKPLRFTEVGTEHCHYWCDPISFYWRAGSRCTTLQFGKEFPRPKTSLTYLLCVAYCPDTCPLPSQFGVGQLRIKGKKGKNSTSCSNNEKQGQHL